MPSSVPSSVVALITLVVLALPGYTFQQRWRRQTPELTRSAFEEVLVIMFSGAAIDVGVAVLFVIVGARWSIPTPRFDEMISAPRGYIAQNLTLVSVWSGEFLTVATATGFIAASPWWRMPARWLLGERQQRRGRVKPNQSAWWLLFHENPGTQVYVGCMLTDGSYIAGYLHSYSKQTAETRDRELTLCGEIGYRPTGATDLTVLPNVNAVSVSAERIQVLTVTYVDATEEHCERSGTPDD